MDITTRLITVLREIVRRLQAADESHWSAWIRRATLELERGDLHGAERLLAAYGGAGSFNDYIMDAPGEAAALAQLRTEAFELASGLVARPDEDPSAK